MDASADAIWLAATWPFVRSQLPSPPAAVAELGCGPVGGHVPALLRAGYGATGVDPEAPGGPQYRQLAFEDYRPQSPLDAVVASVSLHHVADLGTVLDHVAAALHPGGVVVAVEWFSEKLDERTARWCFGHQLRDPAEPDAWLAGIRDEWHGSGTGWDVFWRGWREEHGLHPAAEILRALHSRFVTVHESTAAYYFPDLLGTDVGGEQAAIDAGDITAGCLRYAGQRSPGA